MPITFLCSCGQSLTVPSAYAGRSGKCPRCAQTVVAPAASDDEPSGLKWSSAAAFEQQATAGGGKATQAPDMPTPKPGGPPTKTSSALRTSMPVMHWTRLITLEAKACSWKRT